MIKNLFIHNKKLQMIRLHLLCTHTLCVKITHNTEIRGNN